jgi:hypothetical protein
VNWKKLSSPMGRPECSRSISIGASPDPRVASPYTAMICCLYVHPGTSGDILDSLRESRISLRQPWSLAALVDATSRVSDNYRVKRFSENTPMTMPERLNDTERERADGEAVLRHAFHGEP